MKGDSVPAMLPPSRSRTSKQPKRAGRRTRDLKTQNNSLGATAGILSGNMRLVRLCCSGCCRLIARLSKGFAPRKRCTLRYPVLSIASGSKHVGWVFAIVAFLCIRLQTIYCCIPGIRVSPNPPRTSLLSRPCDLPLGVVCFCGTHMSPPTPKLSLFTYVRRSCQSWAVVDQCGK